MAITELIARVKAFDGNDDVISPLEYWFGILNDPEESPERKMRASENLATYTIAKPKPVDAEGDSGSKLTIVFNDLRSEQQTIAGTPLRALPSAPIAEAIMAEVEPEAE